MPTGFVPVPLHWAQQQRGCEATLLMLILNGTQVDFTQLSATGESEIRSHSIKYTVLVDTGVLINFNGWTNAFTQKLLRQRRHAHWRCLIVCLYYKKYI